MSEFLVQKYGFSVVINDPQRTEGGCLRSGTVVADTDEAADEAVKQVCRELDRGHGCEVIHLRRCTRHELRDLKQREREDDVRTVKAMRQVDRAAARQDAETVQ